MSKYTVLQGQRYRATIDLGFVKSWASNETVADYGRKREATGLWPLPDATADVPDEIIAVDQIEV